MTITKTFTFEDLASQITEQFRKMSSNDSMLFYVGIESDYAWELYLDGFAAEVKQEHNCNSCKSFIRHFAGLVTIKDNKKVSIWDDLEVPEEYEKSINDLRSYIHSCPITDVFYTIDQNCGTKSNFDSVRGIEWNHFYLKVPSKYVKPGANLASSKATHRDDKQVFKRGLEELKIDATETVLELISQNSLYRGIEFEPLLKSFLDYQKSFAKLGSEEQKDNFAWSLRASGAIARIRNTAIGTLLIDLSAGVELDRAVSAYERVVAPTNYKRPTALVTPKMVEQAKEKLKELNLLESMERRYANEADIRVSIILFKDTPTALTDVFDEVSKEAVVNPKTLSKVEEIGIEDFLNNVVPGAKSISVLLENNHLNNLVSLITAKDPETLSPFKWKNSFSWSYAGGITDSIKERVKEAGGRVEGELRTSLSWYNTDDLDIHVVEPSGFHIYYGQKRSPSGGQLDVDMNAGGYNLSTAPVENIIWPNKATMREGLYKVMVNNFARRNSQNSGYVVQIECMGQTFDYESKTSPNDRRTDEVVEFTYSKTEGVKFSGETKSNVVSKEKWGLKTNTFVKVTKLMLSPNHWNGAIGNKHYLFMLEGCVSDETPRAFFNEFLDASLDEHRKVFEILGSKVKIEETTNQLSGVGFSETLRNSLIVKVEGKFTRTLKVNF